VLESAKGLWNALQLANSSPRITTLGLGRVDLTMDLRPVPAGEFRIYPYLLSRIVTIARATGKQPLGAHWREGSRGGVASPELTLKAARQAYYLGFSGCLCAKPEQVSPANQGYTPPRDEISQAKRVVDMFQQARQSGQAFAEADGCFYDASKALAFRHMLRFAQACAGRDEEAALFMKAEVK